MEPLRINKYLASCGLASRRASEEFVLSGRVKVNGKVITNLAFQIIENDIVEVDGKVVEPKSENVYILMNKPKLCVTTCDDQFGRRTVLDVLGDIGVRVFPVGRLDYATEGLLLLTNDGEFARRVMHPSSGITKTYVATLETNITREQLKRLERGVLVDGVMTAPAKAEFVGAACSVVALTITEGRNRQVRKMFEALGVRVKKLKRTAIGKLTLGNLKSGEWMFIKKSVCDALVGR